jgi:hypothetical protein
MQEPKRPAAFTSNMFHLAPRRGAGPEMSVSGDLGYSAARAAFLAGYVLDSSAPSPWLRADATLQPGGIHL